MGQHKSFNYCCWPLLGLVFSQVFLDVYAVTADLYVHTVNVPQAPTYTVDESISLPNQPPYFFTVKIDNNGPDIVDAASSGYNYDIKFYLAESESRANEILLDSFTIGGDGNQRGLAIAVSTPVTYAQWSATLTYPSNKCSTYSHVCIVIVKDPAATYIDDVATNDYKCLMLAATGVDGAAAFGKTTCPTDPSLQDLAITDPAAPIYTVSDTPVMITASLGVFNAGAFGDGDGLTIMPADGHFTLNAYVCSTNDGDMSACHSQGEVDVSSHAALTWTDPWSTVILSNLSISVTLPSDSCNENGYLCAQILKALGATYNDVDTNNYACLQFGLISDGKAGIATCPNNSGVSTTAGYNIIIPALATAFFAILK